jgi:N-acetylglucosaminyldiphosphoundecaprenol N-acetyl-beta-D-mannosaminyltransferase
VFPEVQLKGRAVMPVLGAPIDVVTWHDAVARIAGWAERHESRSVNLCNVHSVVTAQRDSSFRQVVDGADMNLPDGAPIAWALRWAGAAGQPRINGPDVMWHYLARAEQDGHVVSFYGSSEDTLCRLREVLSSAFPRLRHGAMVSPPFRELTREEDAAYVRQINDAGTQTLFVSLGCPKQEHWMDSHRGRIQATMLGVGAAFAYHAGITKRAPMWMRECGMEWLHRLFTEPRRLARRYVVTNSIFLASMVWNALSSIGRRRGDRHAMQTQLIRLERRGRPDGT